MPGVLALCALCLCAACGPDGGEPVVQFDPIDCGRIGCDFEQRIGVGGAIGLQIRLAEGESSVGLRVRSTDPTVLAVVQVADFAGQPTWELTAISPGTVDLEAVDPPDDDDEDEEILDTFEVETAAVTSIGLVNFIGDADGPVAKDGFDEVWEVPADLPVSFRVTPFIDGAPTMGRYDYDVTLDPEIFNNLIDSVTAQGRLHFIPPEGDHEASWVDNADRSLRVLIEAK
jgi:hypothetical protein